MGKTKDYKKIIAQLDNLQEHTRSMEHDGEEIWKQDSEALQEAMDIISDYEKVVTSLNRMIEQYERPEITRKIAAWVYVCPNCGKRVQVGHSYCHWCGKRVSWDRESYASRDYPHLSSRGGKKRCSRN